MKILIINTYYYPNMIGGTEHSVKLLAEGLVAEGNEVFVYSIDNFKSNKLINENINGVTVYRGSAGYYDIKVKMRMKKNYFKLVLNKIVELNNIGCCKEIEYILNNIQPDIVHTNNLFGISYKVWDEIKKHNIPIIHTVRDYWMLTPTYSLERIKDNGINAIMHNFYQRYYRRLSQDVNVVTAASDFILNKFLQFDYFKNKKNITISNCVKFERNRLIENVRRRSTVNSSNITFIYVGSLIEMKGIDRLLEVFKEIDNKNINLIICGSGPLEDMVNESCKVDSRIRYEGQVSSLKLEEIFKQADVLIVPSVFEEPFGRVVIEANINGLPVIASSRGGLVEIINNINTGILFDIYDKEDLKEKISLFTNRNYIKSFYPAILENIEEYSLKEQIRKFTTEYKATILNEELF